MDQWESLIESYQTPPELRLYHKVLQTAGVVLKEDLASFEIDWIIQTLLYKPISLLETISSKRTDDIWFKLIGDSFKLLSEVATQCGERVEQYYEDIVEICLLPYDAQTRKQALHCLTCIVKLSPVGAKDAKRHIVALEETSTCKAPLAILVGTICEYYPEVVVEEITTIWRMYLNLLDSNKNSDTIKSAILQGIAGLFKHFGGDLPTAELNLFYDKLSADLRISKCVDVVLSILNNYAGLFKERLSTDVSFRRELWRTLSDSRVSLALRTVYTQLSTVVEKEKLQSIITTEVLPHIETNRTISKYTAMRILTESQKNYGVCLGVTSDTDVYTLEFELRNESVTYDAAEAVSWCIESNFPNSDKLLQTAILFYDNLPTSKRKDIVVNGIINATPELISAVVNFLITESCHQETSLSTHLPLWRDLLSVDGAQTVFEIYIQYLVFVMETFLEEVQDGQKLPDKLTNLLMLTSHVLTLQSPEEYTNDQCTIILPLLVRLMNEYDPNAALIASIRSLELHVQEKDSLGQLYKNIRIDRCRDEALLCESCLALIQATGYVDVSNILMAVQIIFSRNDAEPNTLSLALRKMETLMTRGEEKLDQRSVAVIISLVEKIRSRKDLVGKDARVLHRDILMFLGKYSNRSDINNNDDGNMLIVKLKDMLVLNIPNPKEGINYKINLQRVLQLALTHEDPDALQTLLVVICANMSSNKNSYLQYALARVSHALCRAAARGSLSASLAHQAMMYCDADAARGILQHIKEERSPGVRRMLSDALEGLLLKDPGSDVTKELVKTVAEYATLMMSSDDSTTKRAGLDVTETLIIVLKENHLLATQFLPNILICISKTNELDSNIAFETASTLFLEKIELFSACVLDNTIMQLLETITLGEKLHSKTYKKIVTMILEFIKRIFDYKTENNSKIADMFLDVAKQDGADFVKCVHVMAAMRCVFDFNLDLCRHMLSDKEFMVLNRLYTIDIANEKKDVSKLEAILNFFKEYAEVLLELQYQRTHQYLGDIILKLTPLSVKYTHKNLTSCLSKFRQILKKTPQVILSSLEKWCEGLSVKEITDNIEKNNFLTVHTLPVYSLKIMLDIFEVKNLAVTLTDVNIIVKKWPRIILKLHASGLNYIKTKMPYLTDLLAVALKFLTVTDIKKLILEGHEFKGVANERIGLDFCRLFMSVFFVYLVSKPFVLLDDDMQSSCLILNDIIKWFIKKKCPEVHCDCVLELVDKLWPKYESRSDFNQKHSLLVDLTFLPRKLDRESNPMRWVVNTLSSQGTSREDMMRLVGVLPGGEVYSASYRKFASCLPVRLSELTGVSHAALRAILDALSVNGDLTLLDIIITLAGGDDAKGWWDEAMDSCMASLALKADHNVYKAVYTRCWEGLSLGVCDRLLVPLLRYSGTLFCEQFLSNILKELLSTLRKGHKVSIHNSYHKTIVDYTRVLNILQIVFEKISPSSIQSPNSLLYSCIGTQKSWYLVREVGMLCYTLRDSVKCPEGADTDLKRSCRLFQCACYKCICAGICMHRPNANMYDKTVFNPCAWRNIVDCDAVYKLPLTSNWSERRTRHAVAIETHAVAAAAAAASGRSVRTRVFLRTLSENPLQYDLIDDDAQDAMKTQDLQLTNSELNSHECAATLTAILFHASSLEHTQWRDTLAEALNGELHRNVKWLLAQAICNSKEDLKPHAGALRPALLAVVSDTAIVENGKRFLNGLHIDILNTIIHWGNDEKFQSDSMVAYLNSIIENLITTCIENRQRQHIYRTLLDCINKVLNMYGQKVQISWSVFEPYLGDNNEAAKSCLTILQRVTKNKIHIPQLLPTLLANLEGKHWHQLSKMAELFGFAVAACTDRAIVNNMLLKYRTVLNKIRKSAVSDYVKMLYYAQINFEECCDEYNFRMVIDLASKLSSAEKSKCLEIISSYITNKQHTDTIADMFDVLDISELVTGDEAIQAMEIVKNGLRIMNDQLKRRVVHIIAGYCEHSLVKVRKAALEVMVKGFEDLFTTPPSEPSAKKQKIELSPILYSMEYTDVYSTSILYRLGCGVADCDENMAKMVRIAVGGLLSTDIAIRFAECFFIAIYLPATLSTNNNKTHDLSVCVPALLEMMFSGLKAQEKFKKIRLREEPLNIETMTGPSKLLTMSRTYQGTLRSHSFNTNKQKNYNVQDCNSTRIDVQVPLENILDTLINFSKIYPESSQAVLTEVMKAVRNAEGRGFDLDSVMARQLSVILGKGANDLTPVALEACRVFVEDVWKMDGFQKAVEKLKDSAVGTEGELTIKLLYEDVVLRCSGHEQFVLGSLGADQECSDVTMYDDTHQFSLEELTSTFGKLSNWDELTLQEKTRIESSTFSHLWTDKGNFKTSLDNYTGAEGWFGKMVLSYRGESKQDTMKWLREIDRWPRGYFAVSAITEAIEWQYDTESQKHLLCDINASDCLAEWAARLMVRSEYLNRISESEESSSNLLSRSHELLWCESASERSLANLVLDCVKRNTIDLYEHETLPWLRQKVQALRAIGLKRNDSDSLRKALELAEKYTPLFMEQTSSDVIIAMNKLILQLNCDLNSLSKTKLDSVMREVAKQHQRTKGGMMSYKNKQVLKSIYESAMIYYDELWTESDDMWSESDIIVNMSEVLGRVIDQGINKYDVFVSIILNRLDDCRNKLTDDAAKAVLGKLQLIVQNLDQFSIDQLKKRLNLFPGHILNAHSVMITRLNTDEHTMDTFKQYFQLICDTDYTLLQYCSQLEHALKDDDASEWSTAFDRMKRKMFENPHSGTDYQLLNKYKSILYEIEKYNDTESSKKREILKDLINELKLKRPQKMLRLSQLCPALCVNDFTVDQQKCIGRLLVLPSSVRVIRFDEQVSVYIDSIQRPCVVRCVLSDGSIHRYLHKSADRLGIDAAAMKVAATAASLWGERAEFVRYNVTPLSDDCGLIEFLEDHVRIRDLIPKTNDINFPRPADHELILAPTQASLAHHQQFCSKIPSYALRSAIESNSSCTQDFIVKKRRYLETLSSMTIFNWIFGLGDRHLENILYSIKDGGVCCIDWAAMFQYGCGELPPARLTRNILAMCDTKVLEARLQYLLKTLRESHKLLIPVIRSSFNWMGHEFTNKLPYIRDTLQGKALSCDITKHVLDHTDNLMYREKYIQLLDIVFKNHTKKDFYSIEEQISCLLQHCTDPRLLSVTRRGWEPWL